jgi:hypothetical protein
METKRERQEREQNELDEALLNWVKMQSQDNTAELYRKALAYFGIQPVIPE